MSATRPPDGDLTVAITLLFEVPSGQWAAAHGLDPADGAGVAQHVAGYFFIAVTGGRISAALGSALPEWQGAGGTIRVTDGAVTDGQASPGDQPPPGSQAAAPSVTALPVPSPLLLPLQRAAPDMASGNVWPGRWWEHEPVRPTWLCRVCSQEWPCRTRRQQLRGAVQDGGRHGVRLLLEHCLIQAMEDQPDRCPGCLAYQLLGWTRLDPPADPEQAATRSGTLADDPASELIFERPPHRPDCPHVNGNDSHDD